MGGKGEEIEVGCIDACIDRQIDRWSSKPKGSIHLSIYWEHRSKRASE